MSTLAEKLANLTNPAPVLREPEEDENFDTAARVIESYDEFDDNVQSSSLRTKAAAPLSDERYSGKKISRKSLMQEDSFSFSSYSSDSDREEISELKVDVSSPSSPDIIVENDSCESENAVSGTDDEDGSEMEDNGIMLKGQENVVQQFSNFDLNEDIEKGKAVKTQLTLWDNLLECRIKMQKVLMAANRLPQHDIWEQFMQRGDQTYKDSMKMNENVVKTLLEKLLELQRRLLMTNPETRSCVAEADQSSQKGERRGSDEEITSESEGEEEMEDLQKTSQPKRRKYNNEEYPQILQNSHNGFIGYRNATIQKWNEKTRLGSEKMSQKSFGAFEQSTLKQIEQILNDRARLHRRTQLKRTVYRVLGKPEEQPNNEEQQDEKEVVPKQLKEYDTEIFDDDDFYHQLLREFIERKTADANDPVALSRQWLEIQRLRSKLKRKVDTKASKGRKIRYEVHPKLVSYMAPVFDCKTTDDAKNELFSSLFGKKN